MNRVNGKVAIVTGGAAGIGEAIARRLAAEGATVAIVDINEDNGQRVAGDISKTGKADYWKLDVSQEEQVKEVFAAVNTKYRRLDILVNNAGIPGYRKPPHETTAQEWDRVIGVNLKGAFFCTKYAAPYMIETGGGSIVNVASIYGIVGCDTPVYDTSKGGLRAMTKSDAIVYARHNIRVNSVHPGNIKTPLFEKLVGKIGGGVDYTVAILSAMCPMDRMGTPEEVANGVLFLASDEASYITGTELAIDGGMLNCPPPVYPDETYPGKKRVN